MAVERLNGAVLLEPVKSIIYLPVRHPRGGEEVAHIHDHALPTSGKRVEGSHHVVALPLHLPRSPAPARRARPKVRAPAALLRERHRLIAASCHGKAPFLKSRREGRSRARRTARGGPFNCGA